MKLIANNLRINPRANPWLKTWLTPIALGAFAIAGTKHMIEPIANGVALIADHDCIDGCSKVMQKAFSQDWQTARKINNDLIEGPKWKNFLQRIQVSNPATETQAEFVRNENAINQMGPQRLEISDFTGIHLARLISFKNLFDWYHCEQKILACPQAYRAYLKTDPNRFARKIAAESNQPTPPTMEEIFKDLDLSKPILEQIYLKGGWKLCSDIMLWSENFRAGL